MRRYVLFNEKRGFFVRVKYPNYVDHYSKDINKADIFSRDRAEDYLQPGDKIVPVEVDIRLA
jgi:hypothetical protein